MFPIKWISYCQVSYYVDGESGFVPTITYTDGYTPEFDN